MIHADLLRLPVFLCLIRIGQPGVQGDRDPRSGASTAWEEQTDAWAADETPEQVGGDTLSEDTHWHNTFPSPLP